MLTTAPRGTRDILPDQIGNWRKIEAAAKIMCGRFGYEEIRTPIFEHTELFLRGIGDTTDIVSKEMYTMTDRGGRSITLRPENTAAVVRAYLENKLYADQNVTRLFYIGPMFRYDRPQAGRFRQFHQFGVEAIGAKGPMVDAEIITLAVAYLKSLGLSELRLLVNSVGCPQCRPVYRERLQEYLRPDLERLCEDCRSRFDRNPMRILDCKHETCKAIVKDAPRVLDVLCDECKDHFEGLQELLTAAGLTFEIDTGLVRGLDYYTKTAFEIQYTPLGAQSAVCGGGRYDGLIEECGGSPTPGIGFAIGMERVLLAMEQQGLLHTGKENPQVYVACQGREAQTAGFQLAVALRGRGVTVDMDVMGRSLKAQMKAANRCGAKFTILLGENELANKRLVLRNMAEASQQEIDLHDFDLLLKEIEQ